VYNVSGTAVKRLYQGRLEAGKEYRTTFDSKGLPAGVYLIRLVTDSNVVTSKVVLIR
jgi:hypothetical protein